MQINEMRQLHPVLSLQVYGATADQQRDNYNKIMQRIGESVFDIYKGYLPTELTPASRRSSRQKRRNASIKHRRTRRGSRGSRGSRGTRKIRHSYKMNIDEPTIQTRVNEAHLERFAHEMNED